MIMTLLPAAVVLGVLYGALLLVLLLLNRRDRQDAALRATVGECLPSELREMVAVSVTVALWRAHARVTFDMQGCAAQTWQVIERLGPRLPRGTTLSVDMPAPAADCGASIRVVRLTAKPGGHLGRRGAQPLTARGA
jgi:broad specificity polyphosphatase/5'/3'-nucleotidase SurE